MIVNRDKYLQELVSSRHNGLVKIITGMAVAENPFCCFVSSSVSLKTMESCPTTS